MPKSLHEYCIYFDGLPRGYHWTQIKDHLRSLIQYPGRDLGYVQPLGGNSITAAYIRLRNRDVAQRIYNALATNGFGQFSLRVVFFDCTDTRQPRMIQSNFNFATDTVQQPQVVDIQYTYHQITYSIGTGFQYMSTGQQVYDARDSQGTQVLGQPAVQYSMAATGQHPGYNHVASQPCSQPYYTTALHPSAPMGQTAQAQGFQLGPSQRTEPRIVNGSVDAGSESLYSHGSSRR